MKLRKLNKILIILSAITIFVGTLYVWGFEVSAAEIIGDDGIEEKRECQGDELEVGGLPVELDNHIEIVEQSPKEIVDFPEKETIIDGVEYKAGDKLNISEENLMNVTVTRQVLAGDVSDYLL